MLFYNRPSAKYMALIPAIIFALLGTCDIIADITVHKLTVISFALNAILFAPLMLRHRIVYIVSGWIAIILALYGLFVLLVWFNQYSSGAHFRYPFDTFVVGPIFAALILLFGISLVYGGTKIPERKNLAA